MEPLGVVIPKSIEDVVATIQIAAEAEVPITARGGGTSLSGQSIGPGIILDCSKYLNAILDIDIAGRVARVQPGVVLDTLNHALAEHGLQFGPDVATASRANLGGMIGNNSAGARSIVYGKTLDHVRRLGVVLADGSRASFGPLRPDEWDRRGELRGQEGSVYEHVRSIVREEHDEIARRFPRILRRVSGYNLDVLSAGLNATERSVGVPPAKPEAGGTPAKPEAGGTPALRAPLVGLHQLIVGSEGTLALVTEAELGLLPSPKARGLVVPQFATLSAAMDALAACLELQPSAVELMDHLLLELKSKNLSLRDTMKVIQGRPQAVLMVEFSSDDPAEIADRVHRLQRRLAGVNGLTALVPAIDPSLRDPLWNLRRAAMPLLYSMTGDRKPVTFIEDTAVAPQHLPEFIARFRSLLQSHGTDGAFYGHASVGCLHIRPVLNLKDPGDVARMRRITEDVTDLVLEYGGSLSGEHGDGLARSEWNEKMFGPSIYRAFCRIKQAFDPKSLLNPGRIVQAPSMTENLRYGPPYSSIAPTVVFDYSRQEGFLRSIELCNGNGACRKLQGGTMCPSYRATRDEKDTTRGRANALRLALAGRQPLVNNREVYDVLDLCLMCKGCKAECPSNVDVAKLKAEFLQIYYRDRSRPLSHWLMAGVHRLNRLGAPIAPVINFLQSRRSLRWVLEKVAGIDRRRSLPPLHRKHFRRWFTQRKPEKAKSGTSVPPGSRGRVLLLADCFTTYSEPNIGRAAVRVLERAGYTVELADLVCCGRAMISKGFLHEARALIQEQADGVARQVADGTPLLGLEPSCLLTLGDEWTELLPGAQTKTIAAAARLAEDWLAEQVESGRCELPLRPLRQQCLLHGHCHQKALLGNGGSAAALRLVPELDVRVLDTGCCGMAGSFGFEREHYELSVQIANLALLPTLEKAPEAIVAAPGTSCRHQIKDLAHRYARHPMEVLEEQLADSI
jgi:FAD/FMN-containing dehydrogenase/Fe-S oxidoreductase